MSDKAKEESKKETVSDKLKQIETMAIKNKQAKVIAKLAEENRAMKERLGRKKNSKSSTKIAGLATLGSKPKLPS